MTERYEHLQQLRKKKRRRRRVASILILFFIVFAIGVSYAYNSFSSLMNIYSGQKSEKSKLRTENIEITKKPFSVLIMGIEDYSTGGQNGRTDSLIYATINPNNQHVSLMSIPRDSRVTIPGRTKKDKINAAYAYGGEKLTKGTVEQLLQLPVDHDVKIDFEGFKKIVDALDGITVDVPFDFVEGSDKNPQIGITFKKGKQHLNGEEALAYVRMRKHDPRGDFGRADRQRQVLSAVFKKMSSSSSILKINDVAKVVGQYVKTDVSVTDGLALYKKFSSFNANEIETVTLEGTDTWINSTYYYTLKEESVKRAQETLRKNLELPEKTTSSQ